MLVLLVSVLWCHYRDFSVPKDTTKACKVCVKVAASAWGVGVTCLSLCCFEVPDTFKVKETDRERIRNMENEIGKRARGIE